LRVKVIKDIVCDEFSQQCSDDILFNLENKLSLNLMKRTENDIVHGHVSVYHVDNRHQIWVFVYDNDNEHESDDRGNVKRVPNLSVRRPFNFPTAEQVLRANDLIPSSRGGVLSGIRARLGL